MKKEITNFEDITNIVGVPEEEKETHINLMENDDNCYIYTRDNKWVTKMRRLVKQNPEDYKCFAQVESDGNVVSYDFVCPKKFLRFGVKSRTGKPMSEEQKAKVRERFTKKSK